MNVEEFRSHMKSHLSKEKIDPVPPRNTRNQYDANIYEQIVKEDDFTRIPRKKINCHLCSIEGMNALQFHEHMQNTHLSTIPSQEVTDYDTTTYALMAADVTMKKINCDLCSAEGMDAYEFHVHMETHVNKEPLEETTIVDGYFITFPPETTYDPMMRFTSPEIGGDVIDIAGKHVFTFKTSEESEADKKDINCHMCSAKGMSVDDFHEHMLQHQAKAGFAVDSDRIAAEEKQFGQAAHNDRRLKKTTHLFSKESSEFSYVDRMLQTKEFRKIVKAERQRAKISHSYDDRLNSDEPYHNKTSVETFDEKATRKKRHITNGNILGRRNNGHNRFKRYYEIEIPQKVKPDENDVGFKWQKEKEKEEKAEENEFEKMIKNLTSTEKFMKREARRKEKYYEFFNEQWEKMQENYRNKRDLKPIKRVKRYYEIEIPQKVKPDENDVGFKWQKEKEKEEEAEENEFEKMIKNLTSTERLMKREARRKEKYYEFFNEQWEKMQENHRNRRNVKSLCKDSMMKKFRNKRSAEKKGKNVLQQLNELLDDIELRPLVRKKRNKEEFLCPVCSKTFKTNFRLNEHILSDHKPKRKATKKVHMFTLHKQVYDAKDLGEEYRNFEDLKTREYTDDIPLDVEIKNVNHTLIPYHLVKGKEFTPLPSGEFDPINDGKPTPAGFAKIADDIRRLEAGNEKYNNKYMKMLFATETERTEEPTKAYDEYNILEKIEKLFPSPRLQSKCTECGETFGSAMEADLHNFDHRMKPHIENELNPENFSPATIPCTDDLVVYRLAKRKMNTMGYWGYDKMRADRINSSEEMRYRTFDWFHFDENHTLEPPRTVLWHYKFFNRTLKEWEVIPNITLPQLPDRNPTIPKAMLGNQSVYSDFSSYDSMSVDVRKPKSVEELAREYLDSVNPPNETFFQQSYFDKDRNSSEIYGSKEKYDEEDSVMDSREFDEVPSAILKTEEDIEEKTTKNYHNNGKKKHTDATSKMVLLHDGEYAKLGPLEEYARSKEKKRILEQKKLASVRNKRKKQPQGGADWSNEFNQFVDDNISKETNPNETAEAPFPITSSFMEKYTGNSDSLYEHVNMTDYVNKKRFLVQYDPKDVRNTTSRYKEFLKIKDLRKQDIAEEKEKRKNDIRRILEKHRVRKYPDLDEHYKDDANLLRNSEERVLRPVKTTSEHSTKLTTIEEIIRNDFTTLFGKNTFGHQSIHVNAKDTMTKFHYYNHRFKNQEEDLVKGFQDERVNVWDTHLRHNDDILKRFEKSRKAQEKIQEKRSTKTFFSKYTGRTIRVTEPTYANQYERMRAGVEEINAKVREGWKSSTRKTKPTTTTTERPRTVIDYREQDAKFNQGSFVESGETTTLDPRFFGVESEDGGEDIMGDIKNNKFGAPAGGGGKEAGHIVDNLKHVDRALKVEDKQSHGDHSFLEDDNPKEWQFAGGTWGPNENMCDYDQLKQDKIDYYELYLRPRGLTTINYDATDYCKYCNITKRVGDIHVHDSDDQHCSEDHSAIVLNKSHTIFPLEFRIKRCPVCNLTFDIPIRDEKYWNHVKSHKRPIISEKDFMYDAWNNFGQCSVCNKTFIPSQDKEWYLYHLYNHSEAGHICVNWTLDDYPYFSMPLNFTGDSYNDYDKYDDSLSILDMGGTNPRYSRFVSPGTVVTWHELPSNELYNDKKE